jgi:predicted aspartyl protease
MGRVTIEFEVRNYADVVRSRAGDIPPEKIRSVKLSGIVDTGATQLVLPKWAADALGLSETGKATVKYADARRETKTIVRDACIELFGREGMFNAVVEPNRNDALVGAIVMENLDLIVDCSGQRLSPREPGMILSEIE